MFSKLVCPVCKKPLEHKENYLVCTQCGEKYEIKDNIPNLMPKHLAKET